MLKAIKKLWEDEDGLTTPELAIVLALVVVTSILTWAIFGGAKPPRTQTPTK